MKGNRLKMTRAKLYSYVCKSKKEALDLDVALKVLCELSADLREELLQDFDATAAVDIGDGEIHDMRAMSSTSHENMGKIAALHMAISLVSQKHMEVVSEEVERLSKTLGVNGKS